MSVHVWHKTDWLRTPGSPQIAMKNLRRYWRAFAWIAVAVYIGQTISVAAHNAAYAHEHTIGHAAITGHVHADGEPHHATGEDLQDHNHADHSEHEAPHSDWNCQHWLAWLTASAGSPAAKIAVIVPFSAPTQLKILKQLPRHWANKASPFEARGPPHFSII